MRPFVHDVPASRVVFGAGALERLPGEVDRLGARRVVLVADDHEAAYADSLAEGLGDRLVGRITEVVMHVPVDTAARAVKVATEVGADLVVTLGGGSATGLGKAIAKETGLPILAVPTTFAGSEATPIWGLTEGGRKTTGRDPRVLPRVVVYDPRLVLTLPAELAAASGMNALAHCVEALYAPDASPLVPVLAEEGVRVLAHRLPVVVARPADLDARADALYGAWLGGSVLGASTMGVHHKLAHVLGGTFDLPHAGVHSALLPYVTAFNASHAPAAMERAARALGAADPAGALWDLATAIGAPTSLAQIGWDAGHGGTHHGGTDHGRTDHGGTGQGHDAVDTVTSAVLASPPANPRPVEAGWIRDLLLAALRGERPAAQPPAP